MAFNDIEKKRIENEVSAFVEAHRPPAHLRSQVDLGFRVSGQSVELFELRPFMPDPGKIIEDAVAKATYVKSRQQWRVYWQRADLKWHLYQPCPQVKTLSAFLALLAEDEFHCFWG